MSRNLRAVLAASIARVRGREAARGCDCKVICSMGPTCPGAILAGLDGAGCHRVTSPGRPE